MKKFHLTPWLLMPLLAACSSPSYDTNVDPASLTTEQQLLVALSDGDTAALAKFLDENPGAINQPGLQGQTLLHHAVRFGNEACVRLLIERGADPNVRDSGGDSVLDYIDENGALGDIEEMVEGAAR